MIENGKVLQQRYRIDKQIGQGGMGAVYIATDERFGSTVAIKETLFMDDNYRKAIDREARLLNSLKHAALPRVSDHFLEENVQFLVMEYIPGEDLSHMLESGVVFDVDRVLKWADQLLDALDFLHNQSIPVIHRDIKPQNLKLTARDQIILLDFGLAKGNPTDAGHQTAAKSIFGYSRNYASLEQIQGTGTDPRSDLYSLAATLYHLLTGAPPEDALTRAMAVLSNRPDPLQPANAIRAEIPRGVAGILQKSLALNADDRPAAAADMREMFRTFESYGHLADPVTIATRRDVTDAFGQQTKLMPSDTRHDVGGQTDVKTAVLPGYVSQETSLRPTATTGDVNTPKRKKRKGLAVAASLGAVLVAACTAVGLYYYDPSIFGDKPEPAAVTVPQHNDAVAANDNAFTNAEVEENIASDAESATANVNVAMPDQRSATSPKSEPAKSQKPADSKANEPAPEDNIRVHGDTVYIGNVKVTPDGIEPNVYVDPKGVRRPIPPPVDSVPFPGLTREQLQQLTPQQRQKILDARRKIQMLERQQLTNTQPRATPPNRPQP
jgi:serine/threonine protein kinase